MNPILTYFIQVIACSGILYGYYHLLLRNKTFHQYNRFYLLASVILSLVLPLISIPLFLLDTGAVPSLIFQTYSIVSTPYPEHVSLTAGPVTTQAVEWYAVLLTLYFIIAAVAFTRVLMAVMRIVLLLRRCPGERLDGVKFIYTGDADAPFSFFRWLFWNKSVPPGSEVGKKMLRHELYHIRQKHSWDVMLMELVSVVFWANPFFHLIRKELKTVHEFLADEFAMKDVENWKYVELLLMPVLQTGNPILVNPFFHNQIKRRIAMITTSKKPAYRHFRKLMVLPVITVAFALFSFELEPGSGSSPATASGPFTVVVDAGHGIKTDGTYDGARAMDGTFEDNLVLAIARKVKHLNANKNLEIVLTRNDENIVTLDERVRLANGYNPDLFLSIHLAAEPLRDGKKRKSGVDVYIPGKNTAHDEDNKIFAGLLLTAIGNVYQSAGEIKQRQTGIRVLDKSNCPAALVECGYITNDNDLAFIKQDRNQEKIALAILNAMETFAEGKQSQ